MGIQTKENSTGYTSGSKKMLPDVKIWMQEKLTSTESGKDLVNIAMV